MKAAVFTGQPGEIALARIPDPDPGPQDVLIAVKRCGVCGTDLAMTSGEGWLLPEGSQFGHEYAGEVVAVGSEVTTHHVGDLVTAVPSGFCGSCHHCDTENVVLCKERDSAALGFAELAVLPAKQALILPSEVGLSAGALVEPLAISHYGVRLSGLCAGQDVIILGAGAVALYTIYWARQFGARRIVVVSRSQRRRAHCLNLGADEFVVSDEHATERTRAVLDGKPQVIFECAGATGMLGLAMQFAGAFTKIVSLGFCMAPDPIVPAMAAYQCVSFQFLVGYTLADFQASITALERDPGLEETISSTISLEELPQMMQTLRGAHSETKVHVAF